MKLLKPTTSGQRGTKLQSKDSVSAKKPHKPLTKGFKRSVGRSSKGRITSRHKGGGHKRLYRKIDTALNKRDIVGRVKTIEYDPNRSGFIALIAYEDGDKRYILVADKLEVGDKVLTKDECDVAIGNRMIIGNIPVGTKVYNIEIYKGAGAKLVRSAGTFAEVMSHSEGKTQIKLPSTEIRKVDSKGYASIGVVSNDEHKLVVHGKAGRKRHMGIRPRVRGSAMNAADHPHGGGEGRAGRGRRRAVSKWGRPTGKGQKTRKPKKTSNVFIVKRRRVGKRR